MWAQLTACRNSYVRNPSEISSDTITESGSSTMHKCTLNLIQFICSYLLSFTISGLWSDCFDLQKSSRTQFHSHCQCKSLFIQHDKRGSKVQEEMITRPASGALWAVQPLRWRDLVSLFLTGQKSNSQVPQKLCSARISKLSGKRAVLIFQAVDHILFWHHYSNFTFSKKAIHK